MIRNKKILTWVIIIASVLLVVGVLAAWVIYSFLAKLSAYGPPVTPQELREARVIVGADFLSRNQFVTLDQNWTSLNDVMGVGSISDIAVGELDSQPGLEIAIAGIYGALIVDQNGTKRSEIRYEFAIKKRKMFIFTSEIPESSVGELQVIDVEGDGTCEYLARGSLDGAAVFSHHGSRVWSYGAFTDEKTYIDDLAPGDLNGDGVLEFVAGWNALEAFDRQGKKRWSKPYDSVMFQLEVVDVDGDRKNEIIHSKGGLTIWDGQGQLIKEVEMPFYLARFQLIPMPGEEKRPRILALEDEHVWLVDFEGSVVNKFAAPLSRFTNPRKNPPGNLDFLGSDETDVYKAEGVWVKLKENQPEFLAVVTEFAGIDRSVFYVYSPEGKLVYHEVLPEGCSSIAVLGQPERNVQELLIGGTDTVWRYNAR